MYLASYDDDSSVIEFLSSLTRRGIMEFLTIDTEKAQKVIDETDEELARLKVEIAKLEAARKEAQDALDIASGRKQLSVRGSRRGSTSTDSSKSASESIEPRQVASAIQARGGTATLDELKEDLGVGGRVIGGALRRDDGQTFQKDDDGNYVTV